MSQLQNLKNKAFQNGDVKAAYDALDDEFGFINQLLAMRSEAGLTQEQLAKKMGTNKSNISRLEKGNTNPTLNMLKRYAQACGYVISIAAEPQK